MLSTHPPLTVTLMSSWPAATGCSRGGTAEPLGHLERAREIGAGHDDEEFLTAPSADDVVGANFGAEAVGECGEHDDRRPDDRSCR